MGFGKVPLGALAIFLTVLSASPLLAKAVGTVLAVTQGAQITTASGTVRLTAGMQVTMGDIIKTNGSGQAQLLFGDETKIAVGPKSQIVLDDILLRSNGSAKRFTINAFGGTFRFISGKSPQKTYQINTPTATMGIRGTIFDFTLSRVDGTRVVLLEGEVELCLASGDCKRASGACTLSHARSSELTVGINRTSQKNEILRDDFPYIVSQNRLLDPFHAPIDSCGDIEITVWDEADDPPPPPPPPLEPPEDPPKEPPSEPERDESIPEDRGDGSEGPGGDKGQDVSN